MNDRPPSPSDTHVAGARRRGGFARRASTFVAALGVVLAGFVVLASPASAHHPEISGSALCAETSGEVEVTYTARTWTASPGPTDWNYYIAESDIPGAPVMGNGEQRTGHVILSYQPDGGSYETVRDDIEYTPTNGGQVTGTFLADEAEFPITLRVQDTGLWKSGGATNGADRFATIDAPGQDCSPPVVCDENETPAGDTTGDGDNDGCEPVVCDEGETSVDSGENGVDDTCEPVICEEGETSGDTGGNGVDDTCQPVVCDEGETSVDAGDNGVDDTCEPVVCEEGETPGDAGGNGVDDTCEPVVCEEGETPGDAGENGVDDTCEPVVCDEGETSVDAGENGVDDTCEPVICEAGGTPTDTGDNGVEDTCVESETEVPECEDDEMAVDTDDDGTDDTCVEVPEFVEIGTPTSEVPAPEVLQSTVSGPAASATPTVTSSLALTGTGSMTMAAGGAMILLLGFGLVLLGKEFAEA